MTEAPFRPLTCTAPGLRAAFLPYGAVLHELAVEVGGAPRRVTLGLPDPADYPARSPYFGAIAGRCANRIARGRFTLDGRSFDLSRNDGRNTLHGGAGGFPHRAWAVLAHEADAITLGLVSEYGEEGFPGRVTSTCRYALHAPGTLRLDLTATADAPTIVNLAHHSYFALDGEGETDVRRQSFLVDGDFVTPTDAELIPTGEVRAVAGTPFDFREPRPLGASAPATYDVNFVLRRSGPAEPSGVPHRQLTRAARLAAARGDLALEVWTTEPGLQVYDGHLLDGTLTGPGGRPYGPFSGICLEPQTFPDAPNRPHFPSATLRPGEVYRQVTEYRFSAP